MQKSGVIVKICITAVFLLIAIVISFPTFGSVFGMIGGALAFLAEWGLYNVVTGRLVGSITGSLLNVIPFSSIALEIFIVYMAIGILVGAFGGVNAIRNYLEV